MEQELKEKLSEIDGKLDAIETAIDYQKVEFDKMMNLLKEINDKLNS